jgi:hypothetical protein
MPAFYQLPVWLFVVSPLAAIIFFHASAYEISHHYFFWLKEGVKI